MQLMSICAGVDNILDAPYYKVPETPVNEPGANVEQQNEGQSIYDDHHNNADDEQDPEKRQGRHNQRKHGHSESEDDVRRNLKNQERESDVHDCY